LLANWKRTATTERAADGSQRHYYRLSRGTQRSVIGGGGPEAEENRAFLAFSRALRGAEWAPDALRDFHPALAAAAMPAASVVTQESDTEPPPEATAKVTATPATVLLLASLTMTLGRMPTAEPAIAD